MREEFGELIVLQRINRKSSKNAGSSVSKEQIPSEVIADMEKFIEIYAEVTKWLKYK